MSQATMDSFGQLPVLKFKLNVKFEHGEPFVVFVDDENQVYEFTRSNNRWRWKGGPFVSVHSIASMVFSYPENPTVEQMTFMGDYVSQIGTFLDNAFWEVANEIERRIKLREKNSSSYCVSKERLINRALEIVNGNKCVSYVYLMAHSNGLIKIGKSKNPRAREKTLQAEDPRLRLVFKAKCDSALETQLHKTFADKRVRGEWFRLEEHEVDWIKCFLSLNKIERTRRN